MTYLVQSYLQVCYIHRILYLCMREHIELTAKIENLQSASLNCGGIWKVRIIDKVISIDSAKALLIKTLKENLKVDAFDKYEEFQKSGGWNPYEQKLTQNLKLIEINNWLEYLHARIDYWSEFELISKDKMMLNFNKEQYDRAKTNFLEGLSNAVELKNYKSRLFRLDETTFDTYDIWWHQIHEDLIFELENELLILNFGWSS